MAWRRRFRRRYPRRRRTMRRRMRRMRPSRPLNSLLRPFTFRRFGDVTGGLSFLSAGNTNNATVNQDGIVLNTGFAAASNVTYFAYSYQFTLSSLPEFSEVTNLFDQYKIHSMRIRFIPFQTQSIANDPGINNQCLSLLHYGVIDYDDASVPNPSNVGVQLLREYESFREMNMFRGGREYKRKIRPHISVPAYQAGITTAYSNTPSRWIDAAYPDVQHYGFKGIFQVFAPQSNVMSYVWLRPEIRIVLSGRSVR